MDNVTINNVEVEFEVVKDEVFTNSLQIAEVFEKRHTHILDIIKALPRDNFTEPNFRLSEYKDKTGRNLPFYNLTRDGFSLLAMSFTGEKAYKFKIAYINAFNKMEAILKEPMSEIDILIKQAELLKENQQKMKALEAKTDELHKEQLKARNNINRILANDKELTVIAYASLNGIKANSYNAAIIGKKAAKLSREQGAYTGAVIDPRFGRINTYDTNILKQVFDKHFESF